MEQSKQVKKESSEISRERKPSDWVAQAEPLQAENLHHSKEPKSAVGNESRYDPTSEEIISTHQADAQQEGVDEEWSGDGAENKDFTVDEGDELA